MDHMGPAQLLQLEAAVGLVWELEILKAAPFRFPREALAAPPGFRNHPACPSPYATILGLILNAPVRCRV